MKLTNNRYNLEITGDEPVVGGHVRLYGEGTEFVGAADNSGTWYDDGDGAYVLRRTGENTYQEVSGPDRITYKK